MSSPIICQQFKAPVAQMLQPTAAPAAPISAPSADTEMSDSEDDGDIDHIDISIDWGTGLCSVAFSVHLRNETLTEVKIVNVQFQNGGSEPPMLMAIQGEDFLWGYELLEMILEGTIDEDQVVDLLKLELYPRHDATAERRHKLLKKQLESLGLTVDMMITKHLKAVMRETMEYIFNYNFSSTTKI
ncbi:hypothetical protein LTR56_022959 [Elasticomyces elasticus]|nr:hypothetical protein LTR56_022959 [Elasticomyces elasticus]KAK3626990.1 hypothetical protein LTR22_022947 [Elasticomyces elasticus]KAK4910833.1 hypothetical protein LTR49_020528 [Elasticomyces elasticus]KAK5750410.1 hypothetical protein LTS12_019518 [Elasticomyces elasticus]